MAQPPALTRRALGGALGVAFAGGASLALSVQALAAPQVLVPGLRPFMKLYASLKAETVWYWYSGAVDIAEPGSPIEALAGIESLIRRDVAPQPDGGFKVTAWESHYYRAPSGFDPLSSLKNPKTGRILEPFHFREGPNLSHYDARSLESYNGDGVTRATRWRQAGPYSWLTREVDLDTAHPLDPAQWPLETSGPRNQFGSFAVHCARTADMLDPGTSRADCTFNYEAISGWLPWMLMGQRPGYLVWRANGCKLRSLDDLPPESRRGFEQTYPAIFAKGEPWTDPVLLWDDYRKRRNPASPQ